MSKFTQDEKAIFIKENWFKLSNFEICAQLNIGESTLRRFKHKLNLPDKEGKTQKVILAVEPEKEFKDKIFEKILKSKGKMSVEELSDFFDTGMGKIRDAIMSLEGEHKNIGITNGEIQMGELEKSVPSVIDQKHLIGTRVKFGFVTDNHLGSKYERLDVLNAVYDRFAKEGITTVYNAGNVIDGEARFNKFDIHVYGMQDQVDYFAEVYPQRKGMTTHFITGDDHEGWYVQREGVNIGKFMEQAAKNRGREDLIYLGHMEHDIILKAPKGEAILRVVHPGGGSSYAYSYTSQKIVESYAPGEKPHIVLGGHYHKASYNYIRGVHFVQGGCTMDQSPFMRKKRLEAHVGGWICEYQQGDNGVIQSFKAEWIPFYGKSFYEKEDQWEYHYKGTKK